MVPLPRGLPRQQSDTSLKDLEDFLNGEDTLSVLSLESLRERGLSLESLSQRSQHGLPRERGLSLLSLGSLHRDRGPSLVSLDSLHSQTPLTKSTSLMSLDLGPPSTQDPGMSIDTASQSVDLDLPSLAPRSDSILHASLLVDKPMVPLFGDESFDVGDPFEIEDLFGPNKQHDSLDLRDVFVDTSMFSESAIFVPDIRKEEWQPAATKRFELTTEILTSTHDPYSLVEYQEVREKIKMWKDFNGKNSSKLLKDIG